MSRAFYCDALVTPHAYIPTKIKFSLKWGHKTEGIGANSPFRALAAEIEAQYVQVSSYNIPASRMLMDRGHWNGWNPIWDQIRLPGAVRGRPGPQKGPSGLKWALLGALGVS